MISLKYPCYPDPAVQKYFRFVKCVLGTGWYKTGGSLPSMEELSEAARPTHRYSPPTIQSMQRTHCFDTHFVLTPIVNPSFNHHHHSTNRGLQLHVFIIQPTCNHQHSIQSMKFSAEWIHFFAQLVPCKLLADKELTEKIDFSGDSSLNIKMFLTHH